MASDKQTLKPTSAPVALITALLGGAAFGASSSLIPLIKLNAMILILALLLSLIAHLGLQRGLIANLLVALVSAALAVVAMWAVWYGLEQGFARLVAVLQQGPKGIVETLRLLASTTSVRVTMSGSTTTHGPDEMRLFWIAETAVLALTPVLGALFSPLARRRIAARLSAQPA